MRLLPPKTSSIEPWNIDPTEFVTVAESDGGTLRIEVNLTQIEERIARDLRGYAKARLFNPLFLASEHLRSAVTGTQLDTEDAATIAVRVAAASNPEGFAESAFAIAVQGLQRQLLLAIRASVVEAVIGIPQTALLRAVSTIAPQADRRAIENGFANRGQSEHIRSVVGAGERRKRRGRDRKPATERDAEDVAAREEYDRVTALAKENGTRLRRHEAIDRVAATVGRSSSSVKKSLERTPKNPRLPKQ